MLTWYLNIYTFLAIACDCVVSLFHFYNQMDGQIIATEVPIICNEITLLKFRMFTQAYIVPEECQLPKYFGFILLFL